MEWNVYRYNINKKKMELWNIFEHDRFREEVEELLSKNLPIKNFRKELDLILRHYFWAKAEHEIIIGPFCGDENARKKIDIYQQIKMNGSHFVNYLCGYEYRWIPCEERLPKIDTLVWGEVDDGRILFLNYGIPDEDAKKPMFYKWDKDHCLSYNVVAWKYRMQPYKE